MKNFKVITVLLSSLLLTFLFISCGSDENNDNLNKPIKVNVEKITLDAIPFQYEFPGNVVGSKQAKLSTKLMGEITYFPFEAGTKVSKGQLLAKIKSADINAKKQQTIANIAQAQDAFNNMKINYDRIKDLYEKGSASKKEYEDMTLAYNMAKQRLKSAEAMKNEIDDVLSYAEIRAPFDGYIVNKFFEQGDIATPGHPLMIIESFNNFKVIAQVSAEQINLLKKDAPVKVYIDAVSQNPFSGKISEINPGANPYSKQFEIQVVLDKGGPDYAKIKSGMYGKVTLGDQSKPIIAIDKNLLVKRGQLVGVFAVSKSNEATLRWIRTGKEMDGKIEVLSGVEAGDLLIIDKDKIKDGQKVGVL
ncbi:MAG TPA: efflux RND transporter periplasmic adaptor subunit [Ignavibacteriaceae bacterium]|nr:efflux RND transporter periplasmic adaptor subunit [Ignavibacteriaceae bacterium]